MRFRRISMKRATICSLFVSLVAASSVHAQSKLSAKWEELTAADFREAIQLSKRTSMLPFAIMKKHVQHLPLANDLPDVRHESFLTSHYRSHIVFHHSHHAPISRP